MLKKRLIFTLLYSDGYFCLSRNFRLQRVGDLDWIRHNYDFANIAFFIDELIVLDVSRERRKTGQFSYILRELSQSCFVPVSAGGGINTVADAKSLFAAGADKIVVNSVLFNSPDVVKELCALFGKQSIIGSIDAHKSSTCTYYPAINNGQTLLHYSLDHYLSSTPFNYVGEIYLTSMQNDGTGNGFDIELLSSLKDQISKPLILSGGAGNSSHLIEGLLHPRVDAVSTAHLFNFIGDGLRLARSNILSSNISLASWKDPKYIHDLI